MTAFWTTPPELSVTVPLIEPSVCCAQSGATSKRFAITHCISPRPNQDLILCSLFRNRFSDSTASRFFLRADQEDAPVIEPSACLSITPGWTTPVTNWRKVLASDCYVFKKECLISFQVGMAGKCPGIAS